MLCALSELHHSTDTLKTANTTGLEAQRSRAIAVLRLMHSNNKFTRCSLTDRQQFSHQRWAAVQ